MTLGYGVGVYGIAEPWGSVVFSAPPSEYSLGDFQFSVEARSEGYKIRIKFHAPSSSEAPSWARRLRILRKYGEWPQSWDDPNTHITIDDVFPVEGSYIIDEDSLVAGQIYYYSLYMLRDDGTWLHDRFVDRGSAYPYARWGSSNYMYQSLPSRWRSADIPSGGDLEDFIEIFGALFDDLKSDCENLLSLININEIHDDLIWVFDKKIAWPTWHAAGGIQRRKETKEAVDLYKLIGTKVSYEAALENISDWNSSIVEGWRYVFFSNGLYDSITPILDTSDPLYDEDIVRYHNRIEDPLKYTNDSLGWHSVAGIGAFLEEIPGISGEITADMLSRFSEIIELVKASYAIVELFIIPVSDEIIFLPFEETIEDVTTYGDPSEVPLEESFIAETSDLTLFISNSADCTTNTIYDRVYHVALEYV